jgi:hypothetical protein
MQKEQTDLHKAPAQQQHKPVMGSNTQTRAPALSPGQTNPDDIAAENQTDKALAGGKAPFKSWGNRIHNGLTYYGVDWLLNSAFGVTFSLLTERTKFGAKYWGKYVRDGLFGKPLGLFVKDTENFLSAKKWGSRFFGIMFGGTAIIPLMTKLENKENKKKIIKSIDETIYGKQAVASDPKFEESYQAVDQESEKTVSVGLVTRLAALTPIIAATMYKPLNEGPIRRFIYEPGTKLVHWVTQKLKLDPKPTGKWKTFGDEGKTFRAVTDSNGDPHKHNWDYLKFLVAYDFGLTLIYAAFHEAAFKIGANLWGDHKDKKQNKTDMLAGKAEDSKTTPSGDGRAEDTKTQNASVIAAGEVAGDVLSGQQTQHAGVSNQAHQDAPQAVPNKRNAAHQAQVPSSQVSQVESLARQQVQPDQVAAV